MLLLFSIGENTGRKMGWIGFLVVSTELRSGGRDPGGDVEGLNGFSSLAFYRFASFFFFIPNDTPTRGTRFPLYLLFCPSSTIPIINKNYFSYSKASHFSSSTNPLIKNLFFFLFKYLFSFLPPL